MLVVCVNFEVNPVSLNDFLLLVHRNALESLANEVGCHQFDIAQDTQNPTKIFLYELYDDSVAFELHKRANHYLEFKQASSEMVMSKSIRFLQKINHCCRE